MTHETDEDERIDKRRELAHTLAENGYSDVYVISKDHAGRVTSEPVLSILDAVQARDGHVTIGTLAGLVDRGETDVRDDVEYLRELGIIDRTEAGIELRHEHVVIEPIVAGGE